MTFTSVDSVFFFFEGEAFDFRFCCVYVMSWRKHWWLFIRMFEVQRYKESFVDEKNTDKLRFLQILFICQSTFTREHQISHTATRTFLRLFLENIMKLKWFITKFFNFLEDKWKTIKTANNRKIACDAFLGSCTENIFLTKFRLYLEVVFDQFFIFLWKEAKIC